MFQTFHFSRVAVDTLNKTKELNSVYYCLFKKKIIEIEMYEKCYFFSPTINKKESTHPFLNKKVQCAYFSRMRAGNVKQEINLVWPNLCFVVVAVVCL